MRSLMTTTNTYIAQCEKERVVAHKETLEQIGLYLTRLLRVFGVIDDGKHEQIGFPSASSTATIDVAEQKVKFLEVRSCLPPCCIHTILGVLILWL